MHVMERIGKVDEVFWHGLDTSGFSSVQQAQLLVPSSNCERQLLMCKCIFGHHASSIASQILCDACVTLCHPVLPEAFCL